MELIDKNVTWVDFDLLEEFMVDVFKGLGVPQDEAEICAHVLITADKHGIDSHGISRLKPIYYDRIKLGIQNPITEFEIVKEGPTTAVVDGNDGMGMVVSKKSMDLAIEKAKKYGMGMVAVRNSTHYGAAGYYPLMAIEEGMIGITGTNARPSIAPTFGVQNMLGTNPLTFGMPTDEEFPFVLDCSTAVSQRGKVEVYARTGKEVPEGWVIGRDGKSKTDSNQILKDLVAGEAALVPLGGIGEETSGYKGYGYATVVELLSAALQDGSFLHDLSGFDEDGNRIPYKLGHFFIAIDTNAFLGVEVFEKVAGEILRQLRGSERAPGQDKIYTAWEKEYLTWQYRKEKGAPINQSIADEILTVKKELKLDDYNFPFE